MCCQIDIEKIHGLLRSGRDYSSILEVAIRPHHAMHKTLTVSGEQRACNCAITGILETEFKGICQIVNAMPLISHC